MEKVKCNRCGYVNHPAHNKCSKCGSPIAIVSIDSVSLPESDVAKPEAGEELHFNKGQIVARRYTINEQIGRGGMGLIYKVYDNVLKEEVVLKTLLPQFTQDKLIVSRFFNEARIARQLSHPNIVRVHDIGMAEKGIYISMELLHGKSLRAVLDELPPGNRLPIKTALKIFEKLCMALEYAHHYTIHRDIKPDNVMILPDGNVKLMDFGISKLKANSLLTETSVVMGTPFYMSPEQLRNSRDVDGRADIYSLGVMLYEILTGYMPTGIPKPASQLIREVPPALDPIVAKCVEPNLKKRFQNATELREALNKISRLLDGEAPAPQDSATPEILKKRTAGTKSYALQKTFGLLLIVTIIVASAFGVWKLEKQKTYALSNYDNDREISIYENDFSAVSEKFNSVNLRIGPKIESFDQYELEVFDVAMNRWKKAQESNKVGSPQAYEWGIEALQCLIALEIWPEDMCFVPAGSVDIPHAGGVERVAVWGFFIDATEVTNQQYQIFCEDTRWPQPQNFWSYGPLMPVVDVSCYDAIAFAAWAGRSLPTESQWAMAAYGKEGASSVFPWGDEPQPGACNSAEISESGEQTVFVAPVGNYPADLSPFGCFDMAGNVSEWTKTASGSKVHLNDADSLFFGSDIIVRGGNFNLKQLPLYESKGHFAYEMRSPDLGFRCVINLPDNLDELSAMIK